MSYTYKILKDNPIAFWPLDSSYISELVVGDTQYNNNSITYSQNNVLYSSQEFSMSFPDISGCGNHAPYFGDIVSGILPIIPGGGYGTKITNSFYISLPTSKDFYGSSVSNGLANKYSSDNDFTFEVWISQSIQSSSETVLMADEINNIGLFWENGDIVFKVSDTESIRWAVSYSKKAIHVVGIYSVNLIKLFIDGVQVSSKSTETGFKFTNSSLDLQIGPTSNSSDYFIVDAPAIYRYGLSNSSILSHYNDANFYIQPIHVIHPDDGKMFSCSEVNRRVDLEYSYGVSKSWNEVIGSDENVYYDTQGNYISFFNTTDATPLTFVINDFLFIPTESGLTNSKIEWRNDTGVSVESSVDGVSYTQCTNGQAIPQYKKDSFDISGILYIRITMSTSDASKFIPRLSLFNIRFYRESIVYSDNSPNTITSENQINVGAVNYSPLARHYNNGIRTESGYGFDINTELNINTVEMFFTPKTTGANTLFYDELTGTKYAWNGSGTVSKASISAFYVNGVDKTSQTNISNFLVAGEPHHIVLVFSSPVTGSLQFNYETSGGPDNLYNNIAIYPRPFTESDVDTHFDLYCGRPSISVSDPVISLTESSPVYYDNDWIVLQST